MRREERLKGMFMASAIGDAMAGPHEGRNTRVSQEFLESGGWISDFKAYNPGHQAPLNVFERSAVPGTYTDDTRLRLTVARFMIEFAGQHPAEPLPRRVLAKQICEHYQSLRRRFEAIWHAWQEAPAERKKQLQAPAKTALTEVLFWWEITKTATSEYLPHDPPLFSPSAKRVEGEKTAAEWEMNPLPSHPVHENLKPEFLDNAYQRNQELPLGMIALLPLAAYFPGRPVEAFRYFLGVNFMDILQAPLYAALLGALLADLLGGTSWVTIRKRLTEDRLDNYLGNDGQWNLGRLQVTVNNALLLSGKFHFLRESGSRENFSRLIKSLHGRFGVGEVLMCTVDEMLAAPLALMDYGFDMDLKTQLETGINYGRDNDTVASILGCLAGAAKGPGNLPAAWMAVVQQANPSVDILDTARRLAELLPVADPA